MGWAVSRPQWWGGETRRQAEQCLAQGRGKWPATYLRATEQEDEQEREESARLLYVAATRTRDMLLINGCMRLGKDNRPTGLGEWLDWLAAPLDLVTTGIRSSARRAGASSAWRCWQGQPRGLLCLRARVFLGACGRGGTGNGNCRCGRAGLLASGGLDWGGGTRCYGGGRVGAACLAGDARRGSAHAPSWVVGRLVHESLSAWRFPDARFEAWAEARARTLGLIDAHMLRDAATRSATLLRRFRGHACMRRWMRRNVGQRYPIACRGRDGSTDHGVIDALYRRDGQWTIVEFKTDHVERCRAGGGLSWSKRDYRSKPSAIYAPWRSCWVKSHDTYSVGWTMPGKVWCEPLAGRE